MLPPRMEIEVHDTGPPQPLRPSRFTFPDVRLAGAEGLVAWGGDFAPGTLIEAYRHGIFPWPHRQEERLWFSPDPRAIISPGGLHISRRLARTIRQGRFRVTLNAAFERVIDGCADREDETWITPAYRRGYVRLHELGWAHSIETWSADGSLAGGLYGVNTGGLFGAESMFHRVSDASKVAMVAMVQHCGDAGVSLIDVQVLTPHVQRMGAVEIPRDEYLRRLGEVKDLPISFCGKSARTAAGPASQGS